MKNKFIDLHTHTKVSDGVLMPEALIELAKKAGIGVLAITEHNCLLPDFEKYAKLAAPEIKLLKGVEVSCTHYLKKSDKLVTLHVVLIIPDTKMNLSKLEALLERNGLKVQRQYVEDMNQALVPWGWTPISYDELAEEFKTFYIGRPQLAQAMVSRGFVSSVEKALDVYLGEFGEKKAYVKKPNGIRLSELLEVAKEIHAIPILAHFEYYQLVGEERGEMLTDMREMGGPLAAMETDYGKYDAEQRKELKRLAREYDLLESAGSDFHGMYEDDSLENEFTDEIYVKMMKAWNELYKMLSDV